jgi:hypothetical protein
VPFLIQSNESSSTLEFRDIPRDLPPLVKANFETVLSGVNADGSVERLYYPGTAWDWSYTENLTGGTVSAFANIDPTLGGNGIVEDLGFTSALLPPDVTSVPEPGSIFLLGVGLVAAAFIRRHRPECSRS